MTDQLRTSPSSRDTLSAEAIAEIQGSDTMSTPKITLRLTLFVAVVALANFWLLLQFGVKFKEVFIIEAVVTTAATLRNLLWKGDELVIDRFIKEMFYGLLSNQALIILWALLLGVTLTRSAIVVTDAKPESVTILGDMKPVVEDTDKLIYSVWITPFGRTYRATVDGSELTLRVKPWIPSSLQYPPAVLVRVPLPHTGLVGGRIEIRDAANPKVLLAKAETTAESASILLGRQVTVPWSTPEWERELKGREAVSVFNTQARWHSYLRPDHPIDFAKHSRVIARFRTKKQIASANDEDYSAAAAIEVRAGKQLTDITMVGKIR